MAGEKLLLIHAKSHRVCLLGKPSRGLIRVRVVEGQVTSRPHATRHFLWDPNEKSKKKSYGYPCGHRVPRRRELGSTDKAGPLGSGLIGRSYNGSTIGFSLPSSFALSSTGVYPRAGCLSFEYRSGGQMFPPAIPPRNISGARGRRRRSRRRRSCWGGAPCSSRRMRWSADKPAALLSIQSLSSPAILCLSGTLWLRVSSSSRRS